MKRAALVLFVLLVVGAGGLYFAAQRILGSDLVRRQIEEQLTARLGQPVKVRSAAAKVFPGIAVDLGDVAIGEPEALRLERIRVFTGLRALFADTVDIRKVAVSNGRPGAGGPPVSFDLDASVLGDRLDVKSLTVRGPSTTIDAKGTLTSIANVEGTFDAESPVLDLNELIAIGGALAPPPRARSSATPPSPMHLVVHLKTPKVRFGADEFRDLSTTIETVPGRVVLDGTSVKLFGGSFKGKLDADTHEATPVVRLTGSVTDVDVAELLERTGSAGGVTGRLSGNVSLAAEGADGATLTRSARGTINATLRKGTLPHLDMVRTVVLAFGKPSGAPAEGSGTAFESLGGTFALANGSLRSENLQLRSRDLDTEGRGTLTIATGAIDARADITLSRELTSQAGTDLRRYAQQDGRVIVPATVRGTLDRPTVFIDVAAAARRAIGNEIQRRATDFLGGLFKKKKKGGGS